ncbi:MAG TPA: hypothetical protein VGL05_19460 [Kribbella sp.]
MTALPAIRPVADTVLSMLRAIPNLNVFDGELPNDPPLDGDGRAHPYCVFFGGGGRAFGDRLNKSTPTDVVWTCRILIVGGDATRARWTLDEIRKALTGKRPTDDGHLIEALDDVIFRTETNVVPSRTSGLIMYRLHL